MKPVPLLLTLPFLFAASAAQAAKPLARPELRADGKYTIHDRGRKIKFRIANDHLIESGPGGMKKVHVSARDHLRKMQDTVRSFAAEGSKVSLVAYEEGAPETEANARLVTNRVSVNTEEGVDPVALMLAAGAEALFPVEFLPGSYLFQYPDAASAITGAEALRGAPGVTRSTVLLARKRYPAFVPNDPFFPPLGETTNEGNYGASIVSDYSEAAVPRVFNTTRVWVLQSATRAFQWYLNKEASLYMDHVPAVFWSNYKINALPPFVNPEIPSNLLFELIRTSGDRPLPANGEVEYPTYFDNAIDINVQAAWDLFSKPQDPVDGSGVRIGIVDDGVQLNHPDIDPLSILTNDDYNYIDGTSATDNKRNDPTPPAMVTGGPRPPGHGTAMAGLVIAQRNNARGISGVAPGARFAAYRVVGGPVDDATFADSLVFGAPLFEPQVTADNPLGLPTGNEWRRNGANIKFDISLNAWYEDFGGQSIVDADLYFKKALAFGVTEGRVVDGSPRGVIYVFPAGNGGDSHGDTNYSYPSKSVYTVSVGAVSDLGRRISYSNPGASLHVVAPSSGSEMSPRVVEGTIYPATIPPPVPATNIGRALGYTVSPDSYDHLDSVRRVTQQILTLRPPTAVAGQPGYERNASGTSVSTALVSGVVALMLEVNPRLGWRDVQEILMRSAQVVDPMMGEWSYNPLGVPMSHKYGAGLVDAARAVEMARVWKNLGQRAGVTGTLQGSIDYREVKGERFLAAANVAIPDNDFAAVQKQSREIALVAPPSGMRVEHVIVRLKVRHTRRGDVGIILNAPRSGQADGPMESYLMVPHREDFNDHLGDPEASDTGGDRGVEEGEYMDFLSVRHWGTGSQNQALSSALPPSGNWSITVWDNTKKGAVTGTTTPKANMNNANVEDRVFVPEANPTTSTPVTNNMRVEYAAVIYHGTNSLSENESPVITNQRLIGKTSAFFRASINASSDLTIDPVRLQPRAPVYNYRVRVLNGTSPGAPELVIAPSTSLMYRVMFPEGTAPVAHLRFDQDTGILTNEPYPDDDSIEFLPLPKHEWLIEVHATNVFGTTRKQIPLEFKDVLSYNEWLSVNFTADEIKNDGISGPQADPDGDGVPNLLEYGMGGQPVVYEEDLLPVQIAEEGNLNFYYQIDPRTTSYEVTPQASESLDPLSSWTALPSTLVEEEGGLELRVASVPIVPGSRQFIRLRSAIPPP